ncbi:FAD-binding oxidoreductase [Methylobacterium sp. NEAU 140]|uniref:FAD-binding oxidoreductase n=1 Tax=Methylobacterium sp. NEAU 140 TaxID=3064945 RepID=UPI0027323AD2|nr:FAD-binding oxidoreductase [Methylobacterium sp. NEAU 140]MDP4025725.1 FAD-binding oxidoreductase [Methylobacterium sp. NEAU 140]
MTEPVVFRWHPAVVTAVEALTPWVKSVRLACDLAKSYRAGQHVDVRLTAEDGYRAQRSYSVASVPDGSGTFELMVEGLPDGEVSGWFSEVAAVGDTVELRGPIGGSFSWDGPDGGPLLLAAGGSGVVPLLAMLRRRAQAYPEIPAALIYSARTRAEAIALAELEARDRAEPGFSLHLTTTREDRARRVDADLVAAAMARLGPPGRVFICGSNRFVGTASDLIVAAGVAPGLIRTERFGA